jgi:hypothetical protein
MSKRGEDRHDSRDGDRETGKNSDSGKGGDKKGNK